MWWVLLVKYGPVGACRLLWTDVAFDLIHRVDTARPVGVGGLDKQHRGGDYNRYVASTFDAVASSLAHLAILDRQLDFRRCGFVDYGAGKGKALIAAARLPFFSLKGSEIDSGLHAVAVSNMDQLGLGEQVELFCQDACEFQLSPVDQVLYFFNPFTGNTLTQCLENIVSSRSGKPRYVIYLNPTEDETFSLYFDKLDEMTFSPGGVEVNFYRTRV